MRVRGPAPGRARALERLRRRSSKRAGSSRRRVYVLSGVICVALAYAAASPAQPAAAPKPCSSGVVARTASYAFSLVIGPREAMYLPSEVQERNIKAGQVMLGGEMAMIGRVPAGMRVYNLEVHVCTRGGAVVTTLAPKIVVDDPKRRRPTKLPVAIMAGVAEGIRDYHYGNDVALRPGARITVTVTVRGERAVLEATVPKRA